MRALLALLIAAGAEAFGSRPLRLACSDFVSVGGICGFARAHAITCVGARDQLENVLTPSGTASLDFLVSVAGIYADATFTLFDLCALSLDTLTACTKFRRSGAPIPRPSEPAARAPRGRCGERAG